MLPTEVNAAVGRRGGRPTVVNGNDDKDTSDEEGSGK